MILQSPEMIPDRVDAIREEIHKGLQAALENLQDGRLDRVAQCLYSTTRPLRQLAWEVDELRRAKVITAMGVPTVVAQPC